MLHCAPALRGLPPRLPGPCWPSAQPRTCRQEVLCALSRQYSAFPPACMHSGAGREMMHVGAAAARAAGAGPAAATRFMARGRPTRWRLAGGIAAARSFQSRAEARSLGDNVVSGTRTRRRSQERSPVPPVPLPCLCCSLLPQCCANAQAPAGELLGHRSPARSRAAFAPRPSGKSCWPLTASAPARQISSVKRTQSTMCG